MKMRTKDEVKVIPTPKQRKAFEGVVENLKADKPQPMGVVLRKAGYGRIANSPCRILGSKGFQSLLDTIDDDIILGRIKEILTDDDKRSSLTAADMLLKLKNRYPDKQIRLGAIQQISDIYE